MYTVAFVAHDTVYTVCMCVLSLVPRPTSGRGENKMAAGSGFGYKTSVYLFCLNPVPRSASAFHFVLWKQVWEHD